MSFLASQQDNDRGVKSLHSKGDTSLLWIAVLAASAGSTRLSAGQHQDQGSPASFQYDRPISAPVKLPVALVAIAGSIVVFQAFHSPTSRSRMSLRRFFWLARSSGSWTTLNRNVLSRILRYFQSPIRAACCHSALQRQNSLRSATRGRMGQQIHSIRREGRVRRRACRAGSAANPFLRSPAR